jgi:hypothetical protein
MIWLSLIAIVLISGGYYDIAVRDLVIAIAAHVLARLTVIQKLLMITNYKIACLIHWPYGRKKEAYNCITI